MAATLRRAKALRQDPVSQALGTARAHLWAAFVFGGGVNILFLASPLFMMQVYGRVLESGSIETLVFLGIALLLALLAMGGVDAARGRLLARAGTRIERLLDEPVTQRSLAAGDGVMRRSLEDLDIVRRFFAGGSAMTLMDVPWTLAFFAILFLLHPILGLVATVGAGLILATVALARLIEVRRERSLAEGVVEVERLADNARADPGDIRALGLEPGLAARFALERGGVGRSRLSLAELSANVGASARFIRMLAHSGALAAGAVLTLNGELVPAAMLAAAILAGRALGPIETLPAAWRQAAATRSALERTRKLLQSKHAVANAAGGGAGGRVTEAGSGCTVAVKKLVALQPGFTRTTIRSISLRFAAGEAIAITGPSGAGKSTLARLLVGADRPKSGAIRLGGLDLRDWDPEKLAREVGWLPQEPRLFAGSLRDNIARFGEAGDDVVRDAVARAGATEMLGRLERGLATDVGAGGQALSPGLRQLVCLARALLWGPSLVILDQPTSQLDAEGEAAAIGALRRLKASGATVIVISHKPVLAALCDKILILEDGAIELFGPRGDVLDAIRKQSLRAVERPAPAAREA